MTKIRSKSSKAQVINALRDEMPSRLSPAIEARLLARVETSVLSLGGLASATSDLGPSNTGRLGPDPQISMADRLSAMLATKPVTSLVSVLVLGGVLGALSHAGLTSHRLERTKASVNARPPSANVVSRPIAAALPNEIIAVNDLPTVPAVTHSSNTPNVSPVAPTHAAPGASANLLAPVDQAESSGLDEQLVLLETARRAVSHRDAVAALKALSLHAERFPNSVLTEEREALTIKAMVLANQYREAIARAEKFEAKFPNSLLLPTIRQTIRSIP